jgi:hypothetical protein
LLRNASGHASRSQNCAKRFGDLAWIERAHDSTSRIARSNSS